MHLDRIHRRLNQLTDLGIEMPEPIPSELVEIETLEKKLNLRLPEALRELYLWGGNQPGLFAEMELLNLADHLRVDFLSKARNILADDKEDTAILKHAIIIQMNYDGHFSYIPANAGDDPHVYTHLVPNPTFCSAERFTDYLSLMIEQCAGLEETEDIRNVDSLKRIPEFRARRIQYMTFAGGLDFGGAIPTDLFGFKELRTLDLAGKNLFEISPRIAELGFLKRLYLARNSLANLPMALTQLDELEELDLSENQLTTVIHVLQKLPALRHCVLKGNPIPPDELTRLQAECPNLELIF